MRKPMTEREVFDRTESWKKSDHYVWMEERQSFAEDDFVMFVCMIGWCYDGEDCYRYWMCGSRQEFMAYPDGYGKTWRCWSERPTDAERKAAEWEG